MYTHQHFYDRIWESPDDDTPRLVFADWLEDNGETDRAEFIRLSIQSSWCRCGLCVHRTQSVVDRKCKRLASFERVNSLLRTHGREWVATDPLTRPWVRYTALTHSVIQEHIRPGLQVELHFQRGFPHRLRVSAYNILFLDFVKAAVLYHPVQYIQVTACRPITTRHVVSRGDAVYQTRGHAWTWAYIQPFPGAVSGEDRSAMTRAIQSLAPQTYDSQVKAYDALSAAIVTEFRKLKHAYNDHA